MRSRRVGTAPRRSQQYLAQAAAVKASPLALVVAILTFIIMLLAVPIFYHLVTDTKPALKPYEDFVNFLGKQAGSNKR